MAEFPAFPLWTDAYMADCGHLSDVEHGRYLLILIAMWRAPQQRLPNDTEWFSRKFGRSLQVIENEWIPLMQELCQCDGNWWTQKRLQKEWAYVKKYSESQRERANKRWHKGKPDAGEYATPHRSGNAPTPTPTPHNKGNGFFSGHEKMPALQASDPWEQRVREYKSDLEGGKKPHQTFWARFKRHDWGPLPGDVGCHAPAEILTGFGFHD